MMQNCYLNIGFAFWWYCQKTAKPNCRRSCYSLQVRRTLGIFPKAVFSLNSKVGKFKLLVHAYS